MLCAVISHEHHGASHHRPLDCLFKTLFSLTTMKYQSSDYWLCVVGIPRWPVDSPTLVTGGFSSQSPGHASPYGSVSVFVSVRSRSRWGNYSLARSMAPCKTVVSPLLTHWRYCSLALNSQDYFPLKHRSKLGHPVLSNVLTYNSARAQFCQQKLVRTFWPLIISNFAGNWWTIFHKIHN